MTQAGANDGCNHHINSQRVDLDNRSPLLFINKIHDLLTDQKGQREKKSIPSERMIDNRKDENVRANVPGDVRQYGK